ncbi:MAG: hypothetical protein Q9174_000847 [Haloplaca sp. 1 TL-2023]
MDNTLANQFPVAPPAAHLPVAGPAPPPAAPPAAPQAQHNAGPPINALSRFYNNLLQVVLIILSPAHRFVDRFNLRLLLTVMITLCMLGAGGVLIDNSHALWVPIVPAIGAVCFSFVSRQHWLHLALPVAVLAYTLLLVDIGIATLNSRYREKISRAVLSTVTALWILGLPVAWFLVLETWKFGATLDDEL